MKQINPLSLTRLLASASTEFHNAILNIIIQFPPLVAVLGNLVDDYRESIELQQRATGKDLRLANTRAITEKDSARDAFLKRFFKAVGDLLKSPIAEEKEAAQIVSDAISRFRGLHGYEMNKQTGETRNLIATLRQPTVWDAVLALGLNSLVNRIEGSNIDFETEMNARVEGESQKENLNNVQQRRTTESLYAQIVQKLNALSIVTPSAETDSCIDLLNALIDGYARTISRMRPGGSGNEKRTKKNEGEDDSTEE